MTKLQAKGWFVSLAFLVVSFTSSIAKAQATSQAPPTPQSVKLSLIVTDRANHSIDEVRKEDIQVIDEGVAQTVSLIAKDDRPINYGLVIDNSGSFRDVLGPAVKAAKLIIEGNRVEDETFVERFINSKKIETVQEFTSEKKLLTSGLDLLYVEGGQSAVIDALYLAIDHTAKYRSSDDSHRRAVVVFTDCEERNGYYSDTQLFKLIRTNNVQVFVVGIVYLLNKERGFIMSSPREKAEKLAKRLAEESGGRVFFPKDGKELLEASSQIVHDLHVQFIIGYERQGKTSEKDFRRIRLTIGGSKNLTAIVRAGYSVGVPAPVRKRTPTKVRDIRIFS